MSETTETGRRTPTGRVSRPLLLTHGIVEPQSLVRFGVAGAVLALVWVLVGLFVVGDGATTVDAAVTSAAPDLQTERAVRVARSLSLVGDLPVVSAAALLVAGIAYRRSGRLDLGWLALAVIGGALAVTATVKGITDRARPDGALTEAFSSAFPSGHAVRAAATYALVAYLVVRWTSPHRRWTRAAVVIAAVAMVLGIGGSRILLGAHWLSDVLAGYVVGLVWFGVCVVVTRPTRAPRPTADATGSTDA
jgi:membrane-associated phospholipid phosphatase